MFGEVVGKGIVGRVSLVFGRRGLPVTRDSDSRVVSVGGDLNLMGGRGLPWVVVGLGGSDDGFEALAWLVNRLFDLFCLGEWGCWGNMGDTGGVG